VLERQASFRTPLIFENHFFESGDHTYAAVSNSNQKSLGKPCWTNPATADQLTRKQNQLPK